MADLEFGRRALPVPIRQIGEVALVVTDLDRSIRFYTEVLGLPLWDRHPDWAAVRLANGLIGLWLPGAWELPRSENWAAIRLEGGARAHLVFFIELKDADEARANLRHHGVRYYGPRVTDNGDQIHIDFEDPDGHMLEYLAKRSFEPPPDRPTETTSG
jgi:catechol 2,3-dioxygenase-like lactoylglutathione lyase family enzyme